MGGVKHVRDAEHAQVSHAGPDPCPVLQLLGGKSATLRQVELQVALSQRLRGDGRVRTGEPREPSPGGLTWFSGRPLLSGTKRVDWTFRSLRRFTKRLPSSDA